MLRSLKQTFLRKSQPPASIIAQVSLAPKVLSDPKDLERVQPYLKALNDSILAEGVTNIALTGNYGSGKSTIIKTFQNAHANYRYLRVSLASFKDNADDQSLERKLEVSILQQIFYHVQPHIIPDSRFKRIVNITDKKMQSIVLCSIVWLVCTIALFKFDHLSKLNPDSWEISKPFSWWTLVFSIVFFGGLGFFAKTLVRLLANSKISKLNIKGEFELGQAIDKSIFNQHLEEILYFFERTDFNVVIIEDLDRFESTDIFTKLRELNLLLNNSDLIKREVNFIYAIKDEMFTNKNDRVKFFERIIPVIPFINPTNAGDQLTKLIGEAKLEGVLSKNFTEDIVTFIDDIDMRLLTNIVQEYQIYRTSLARELNQDELFAMIVYKNLFPEDFAKLPSRKGNLYQFISDKSTSINKLTSLIDAEIQTVEDEIRTITSEQNINIKELRSIYIHRILTYIPNATGFQQNDSSISFSEIIEDEKFHELSQSDKIQYCITDQYGNSKTKTQPISFKEIEKSVNSRYSYTERAQSISNRSNTYLNGLKNKLQTLKTKKSTTQSWTFKKIFEEDHESSLGPFEGNNLVRNLLVNGYINENYNDYISLFHDINLSKEDFLFERNVRSGVHTPFDYKLNRTDNLVGKIRAEYFTRDVILNFDLMNFLAENYDKHRERYDSMVTLLNNEKDLSLKFIRQYTERNQNIDLFIKVLCNKWSGMWHYVINHFTDEESKQFLLLIISHSDVDDIDSLAQNSSMKNYIEQYGMFVYNFRNVDTALVERTLVKLDVKFESLQYVDKTILHLPEIYKNNNYRLTAENITNIITAFGESKDNLPTYTNILNSSCDSLIAYVQENISEYVRDTYSSLPDSVEEELENLLEIMNMPTLEVELEETIVQRQICIITELSRLHHSHIQQHFLRHGKVSPNWNNLLFHYGAYIEEYEVDSEDDDAKLIALNKDLIVFLNDPSHFNLLSQSKMEWNDEELLVRFIGDLIYCEDLSQESYSSLLKSIPLNSYAIEIEKLDRERIESILKVNLLQYTQENYLQLRSRKEGLSILFLEEYQDELLTAISEWELSSTTIYEVLNSKKIRLENKHSIIRTLDEETLLDEKISLKVCELWPDRKLRDLSTTLLLGFMNSKTDIDKKLKILNLYLDEMDNSDLRNAVELLGGDYPNIFKRQHKPLFKNMENRKQLFTGLKSRKMIIRFEVLEKKDRIKVFANY